jgi:hypothetical protein
MSHARLFAFESDFVATLRCIPMAVRFKLDRVEIKLSLRQWSRFTREDRRALLLAPCETESEVTAYRDTLRDLVAARAGDTAKPLAEQPPPVWTEARRTPEAVTRFAGSLGTHRPSDRQWAGLSELQRFVLVKLTRDNHDNINFLPAMREFGLISMEAAA